MPAQEIHLFFSYYFKDEDDYDKIVEMLRNRGYFPFSNYSMEPDNGPENEEYIRSLIRPKIDKSSVIVVLVGPGTYTRKWVNWEINYAFRKDKRIVGVFLWGHSGERLPKRLRELRNEDYSDLALVGWNTERIVAAIRGEDIWEE